MNQIAIYLRVSTKEQDEELQLKDIYSMIPQGGQEIWTYQDKQSGWNENKDREAFERLKKDIQGGKLQHLYVWDWDRIYRRRTRLKEFFVFCNIYKVKVHSFRQKFVESLYSIPPPFDEIIKNLFIDLLGYMAEEESQKKSDRVKLAIKREEGMTKSYKGNKWGRKSLSTFKLNLLKEILERNPRPSIRNIATELNLSIGVVHKYMVKIKKEKGELNQ